MIVNQQDKRWWFALNGATRHGIVRGGLNSFAKPVVLTEYPKSGGTWMSQMLGEALGIPYPRNRLPHLKPQIIHGCYRTVHQKVPTIVLWRDGRDTMVSFYYHLMFEKPNTSAQYSRALRQELSVKDPYDIQRYLPRFIAWAFEGGYPGFSWNSFVQLWKAKQGHIETSYEAITADPKRELSRILAHVSERQFESAELDRIVKMFSFEAQSNRLPGEEDVTQFIRKGIVGDWRNVFDKDACDIFNSYAGAELKLLGYETRDDWVEQFIQARQRETSVSVD